MSCPVITMTRNVGSRKVLCLMRLYLIFLCILVVIFLTFNFANFSRTSYETPAGTTTNSVTPSSSTTNSKTSSNTPSNSKTPSNTTTNSKTPSSSITNSETPSCTVSNSKTLSSSITNSETPSPSNETEVLPRTGVVYLIHLPKTGGSYLKDVIDSMVEEDKSMHQFDWDTSGKTTEDITDILEDLEEADYYDQIHFFQHHHRYPSVVDIVPVLLDYKKRSEEKGFIFDIILASMRDPLDLSMSQYNYGRQWGYYQDMDFQEFMGRKPSPLTDSIMFPTPIGLNSKHPWNEARNKTVEEILQPIFEALSNIDYVLFSETLDDEMQLYFECKLNRKYVPISPVNVSKKFLYKEELDLDIVQEFYRIHAIDQYLYSKSHSLFFLKDIC